MSESATEVPPALIAQHDALRIVELLRRTFQIHGAVANYDEVENEIGIAFKEPGQIWEISIDKTTGHAAAHHEVYNFAALINNLHRGRYTGGAWSWVIDGSAALNVHINAPQIKDRAFVDAALKELDALLTECAALSEQVHDRVKAKLG